MLSDERIRLLRGIAFGDDPAISPRDRLDALSRLDEDRPRPLPVEHELLDDEMEEVAKLLTDLLGREQVAAAARGDERFPRTIAAFERAVEKRARELADVERLEAEIEQRAEARAAELYLDEGWRSLRLTLDSAAQTAAQDTEPSETTTEPSDGSETAEWPRTPLMAFPDELPPRRRRRKRKSTLDK